MSALFSIFAFSSCSNLPKKYGYDLREDFIFDKSRPDLKMNVYSPRGAKGPSPVVIVIHGGGWRSRSGDMASICKDLAGRGFVAIDINYRLAPKHVYPAAVDDVRLALQFVRNYPSEFGADREKIFMWGYSAGAHLALMVGLPPDSQVKGIIAGGSPTDLFSYPRSPLIKKFLGKNRDQDPELWRRASPINYVSKDSPPVFMYHGKDDWLVGIDQMHLLRKLLEDKGVPVETKEVAWYGHVTTFLFSQASVDEGIGFLERRLK